MDGLGAIVISPTKELAGQTYKTLRDVGRYHDFSCALLVGGQHLKDETSRMDKINIVICTPGRLHDHLHKNCLLDSNSLSILVLDEADRLLDMTFAQEMNEIIENLPADRQTLLFSATQTKSVKDLARLSLKAPEYVAPHDKSETNTPSSLQQNYVVIKQEDKMTMLWSFIKSHLKNKTIVFLSSCKQVKYMYEILSKLRPGVSLLALYGTLHQSRRTAIYNEFCERSKVVLFATDIASRGLDFPAVSWVIQLDCPEDAFAYIHRAGRTARNKSHGESLLVLTPSEETAMLEELRGSKIPINQISIDPKRMFSPQVKMEAYVAGSTELKESAQRAFVAYIKSVYLMKNKSVFDVESIDFDAYAKSLGLMVTPRVRFLQRIKKKKEKLLKGDNAGSPDNSDSGSEDKQKKKLKSIDLNAFMADDSDDDDAGLMTVKRRNPNFDEFDDGTPLEDLKEARKEKKVTKAALAKKIIKKKIVANKKVQYDEEGMEITNTAKQLQSELAKEYERDEDGGIDLEKAKELLREEDKFDKERFKELVKQKHREQKKKLKKPKAKSSSDEDDFATESEGEEPDLSWLPDYDKINGKQNKSKESDASGDENSGDDSEEDQVHRPPSKLYEKKRAQDSEESDEEKPVAKKSRKNIAGKLSLNDAEALAMSLIGL